MTISQQQVEFALHAQQRLSMDERAAYARRRIWDGLGPMHAHERLSLLMMSKPHVADVVYGAAWVMESGPCLQGQLKASSGRDQRST